MMKDGSGLISCRRSRTRFALAVAALVELCLVAASPLWHHNHHETAPLAASDDGAPVDLHVCNTGDHAAHPASSCPICLSHRLLTHGLKGPAVTPPEPAISGSCTLADMPTVAGSRPEAILPRGPPAT
jgi:hypothetical protein